MFTSSLSGERDNKSWQTQDSTANHGRAFRFWLPYLHLPLIEQIPFISFILIMPSALLNMIWHSFNIWVHFNTDYLLGYLRLFTTVLCWSSDGYYSLILYFLCSYSYMIAVNTLCSAGKIDKQAKIPEFPTQKFYQKILILI